MKRSEFLKSIPLLGATLVVAPTVLLSKDKDEVIEQDKGVLLIPEDAIPDGMTLDEIANQWQKLNGVIEVKPNFRISETKKCGKSFFTNVIKK